MTSQQPRDFFVETMGIGRFMHMDNLAAKDTEGTFLGKPGELGLQPAYRLRGRYSDRTNTAGIGSQHVQESLDRHGDAVQHVARAPLGQRSGYECADIGLARVSGSTAARVPCECSARKRCDCYYDAQHRGSICHCTV
jgi:hypothetical protein